MRLLLALGCAFIVRMPLAIAEEGMTLKERLSDKASDAQRVDDCRVPPDRRGSVARPDCPDKPQISAPAVQLGPEKPTRELR
jgi:hypothetical protein